MPPGLFITGTDTGVGKTYVAALIAQELASTGRQVGIYKPVASGCRRDGNRLVADDAVALWDAAGRPGDLDAVCPQRFTAPLAPHRAAHAEGLSVDSRRLRSGLDPWRENSEVVLVEGAGGLMSPISDDDYNADLAAEFEYPLVVVAANVLGTINQTLQTLITAATFRDGLSVAGVVLNDIESTGDESAASNAEEISARCVPPLLASVSHHGRFDRPVDWLDLAR
jgi:dethiobiotin synthetase